MKILEKELTFGGFNLKQVLRDGKFAIYKQTKKGWKLKRFEVIIIESHNGYDLAGQHFPPSEVYPSSNQWGLKGFTELTYEAAIQKLEYLRGLPPSTRGRKKKKK
jgi:hypothetical protein